MKHLFFVILLLFPAVVSGQHHGHAPAKTTAPPVTLATGLGDINHPVTTNNAEAQKFFNQGLAYIYAFNHAEAVRSFKQAAQLDPNLAMAYWGEAMSYNHPLWAEQDTAAARKTLERLALALRETGARRVFTLGDNFHDSAGVERLEPHAAGMLAALTRATDWVWITGNHDAAMEARAGGALAEELERISMPLGDDVPTEPEIRIAQAQRDFFFRLLELFQLTVCNVGERGGPLAQQRIDRRLIEHHARRPAERPGRRQRAEALDELAVDPVVLRRGEGRGMRRHGRGDAEVLKHAHHLVIQGERARLVVHRLLALDRDGLQAEGAEEGGADRPGGPQADDGYVEAIIHPRKHAIQTAPARLRCALPRVRAGGEVSVRPQGCLPARRRAVRSAADIAREPGD